MDDYLYHTTSERLARLICRQGIFRPHNGEAFVSFSKIPFKGDIRHNEVTLVFPRSAVEGKVMDVEYSRRWAKKFPEHVSYIAGEGWREQFELPDDCFDEEGEEDSDCVDQAYATAELDSFLWKSNEQEVISVNPGEGVLVDPSVIRIVGDKTESVHRLVTRLLG